jgi:hypothetical protein
VTSTAFEDNAASRVSGSQLINATKRGTIVCMARLRISTTVDGAVLERARELSGVRDGEMFDAAMRALINQILGERELEALRFWPYADDVELTMPDAPPDTSDALPYSGEVPPELIKLAKARRLKLQNAKR